MLIPLERHLSPEQVDARLRQAHRARRSAARALAFYLKEVNDRRLYEAFGYASILHYARDAAELTNRQTRELLRVAEALETLPLRARAYASAALPWSSVREICRVATPETEAKWIEEASRLSCGAVEGLVARACFGDSPGKARERRAGEGVGVESVPLVLHVRPEIKAAFEEALRAALRATGGESLEEGLVYMAEQTLEGAEAGEEEEEGAGGGGRTGEPRFQVVLYRCEACGGATVGKDGPPAPAALEARAKCDAEEVDLSSEGRAGKSVSPKARRVVLLRDGHRCVVPGCTNRLWLEVHHLVPRAAGGSNEAGNLATLCGRHHGLVHEGSLRSVRGEEGRLRWFGRTGREIGRASRVGETTHVGRSSNSGGTTQSEDATHVGRPDARGKDRHAPEPEAAANLPA
ncbi:MAG TPA: HNH endonuclease signature motif containing protein [Planctomycetota bacterium]|jgi:hypothetical protein|nr:HNH endonuclease signature motif containing protein [Planctomycetota bacterium]